MALAIDSFRLKGFKELNKIQLIIYIFGIYPFLLFVIHLKVNYYNELSYLNLIIL